MPKRTEFKDPVIIHDLTAGYYWRANSSGYTSAREVAGIYERAEAESIMRGCHRKYELLPVPEDNAQWLRMKLAAAKAELEKEEKAHLQTIGERDDAEDAFQNLAVLVLGEDMPDLSSEVGYDEVANQCSEVLAKVEAEKIAMAQALEIARAALGKISRWKGEFPETGLTWDDGSPMSYKAAHGYDGARDYMREIARSAISDTLPEFAKQAIENARQAVANAEKARTLDKLVAEYCDEEKPNLRDVINALREEAAAQVPALAQALATTREALEAYYIIFPECIYFEGALENEWREGTLADVDNPESWTDVGLQAKAALDLDLPAAAVKAAADAEKALKFDELVAEYCDEEKPTLRHIISALREERDRAWSIAKANLAKAGRWDFIKRWAVINLSGSNRPKFSTLTSFADENIDALRAKEQQ